MQVTEYACVCVWGGAVIQVGDDNHKVGSPQNYVSRAEPIMLHYLLGTHQPLQHFAESKIINTCITEMVGIWEVRWR